MLHLEKYEAKHLKLIMANIPWSLSSAKKPHVKWSYLCVYVEVSTGRDCEARKGIMKGDTRALRK